MTRVLSGILLVILTVLISIADIEIPVIEDAESIEVIGTSWKRGDTRSYAIYLDSFGEKVKVPVGHTYITFNILARTKETGQVVMIFDLLTVIDRNALGYNGIGYTSSRIVTDLKGRPVFYQNEEWVSSESYQPGKTLMSYENYRRMQFNIRKDKIQYYYSDRKTGKRSPDKTIDSESVDILTDNQEWAHLALYLQWKEMRTYNGEELKFLRPIKSSALDYYPVKQGFSELRPVFGTIKIEKIQENENLHRITAGQWAMLFNDRGILIKADNGKGLVVELEE